MADFTFRKGLELDHHPAFDRLLFVEQRLGPVDLRAAGNQPLRTECWSTVRCLDFECNRILVFFLEDLIAAVGMTSNVIAETPTNCAADFISLTPLSGFEGHAETMFSFFEAVKVRSRLAGVRFDRAGDSIRTRFLVSTPGR